jgi:biopolymer transport protein ExbB/TolQ
MATKERKAMSKSSTSGRFMDGSILLGAALTIGFYGLLSWDGLKDSFVHKYTTEHAVEYVIVSALAWGLSDLLLRCLGFRRELNALTQQWLPPRLGQEPASRASEYCAKLRALPPRMQQTRLGKRLLQALVYVHEKQSASGFDEHLRDLSDRDFGQTHTNYAVPRFVVWMTPVLGFLGTVVHFGMALGSLSPDDLAKNLPVVVAGMGTAFDTTTMALASSVSIMLGMFLVERTEQGIVQDIDGWVERELANRFSVEDADVAPVLKAIEQSNRSMLTAVQESTAVQVQAWPELLGQLYKQHEHWQRQQLEGWSTVVARQQQRDEASDAARETRLRGILDGFTQQASHHHQEVSQVAEQVASLQRQLGQLTQSLGQVLSGEGQMLALQKSLAENLSVLQQTQEFDQAVNNLTAAIHLLTVRQQTPLVGSKAA